MKWKSFTKQLIERTNKNHKKKVIFFLSFFSLNKTYIIVPYKAVFPYQKIKKILLKKEFKYEMLIRMSLCH